MRALGYLLFDPEASPAHPFSRASLQGDIARFCPRNGHVLSATFADPTDTVESRPALHQLMQHLREQRGQFVVVVTDPSHLGFTLEEAVNAVLAIDALGSKVISTELDLPDPLQSLARALSTTGPGAQRRQRIVHGMQSKALQGQGLGKPPYGYRIGDSGKLEELPVEAELVRLVFRLYLEDNLGIRTIAGHLNQQGYRTRRGGNWSVVTIRDILRNRAYIGTYHRFGLRLPRNHTPLLPPETFRRVQDLMLARTPRRHAGVVQPYLLSGLTYCAQCGNKMMGVTRRQAWRNKDGKRMQGVYRYYQCQSRANQSMCRYHTWRANLLEESVLRQMREQLEAMPQTPEIPRVPSAAAAVAGDGEAQRRRRRQYMKYLKQATDGAISLRQLRLLLIKLEPLPSRRELDVEPDSITSHLVEPSGGKAILDIGQWEELALPVQRQLLRRWIERIDVGDQEAKVVMREEIAH